MTRVSVANTNVSDYGRIASGVPSGRGKAQSRVREVRERMTSQTGTKPQFDLELAQQFAINRLSASLLLPLLALSVAGIATLWFPVNAVAIWLGLVMLGNIASLILCRSFLKNPPSEHQISAWRGRLTFFEAINGISWAMILLLPIAQHTPESQIFLFVTLLLVIAVHTMLSFNLPSAVWVATLPMTCSFAATFAFTGQPVLLALSGISAGAQIFFLVLGHRLHRTALDGLAMRAEKDCLIVELEQARVMSDEARNKAEQANLAKSRFLATMSHELRTPLNAILGFSEVMKAEILGPMPNATYKEYAGDIHHSGQHLLNLINEILDLSRIEADKFELNEEVVNLVYSAEDSVRLIGLRAKNKGVTIKEVYEEGMPALWADSRAIRQILLNLLSNAIKFTPADGTVFVKVGWTAGGGQYLTVRDTGPGIPEDEIETVLSSFGQGTNALKTAEQGTGLGLPIVRGLVELHGGSFIFRSKVKVGTEVTATFPAERVMTTLPPVPKNQQAA